MSEIAWPDERRRQQFETWLMPLTHSHRLLPPSLRPASTDASFRRYLRIDASSGISYIIMDVPPGFEDVRPFVQVAGLIAAAQLHGPAVLAQDIELGFLLLTDLGGRLYLQELLQANSAQADQLMRDAFISWDEERELDWAVRYWSQARAAGLPVGEDFGEFWRALEWMGLQRHLKVMGIFCRLKHRDGKPHYSTDLPRFFAYATKVALRYQPLKPLLALIEPLSGMALESGYTF